MDLMVERENGSGSKLDIYTPVRSYSIPIICSTYLKGRRCLVNRIANLPLFLQMDSAKELLLFHFLSLPFLLLCFDRFIFQQWIRLVFTDKWFWWKNGCISSDKAVCNLLFHSFLSIHHVQGQYGYLQIQFLRGWSLLYMWFLEHGRRDNRNCC